MASPIWEEESSSQNQYQHDDDDVPLSFYPSSFSSSSRGAGTAGVRRSHTVTAAGSRLHRISSSGGNNTSGGVAASSSTSDRPLSASTGISRRTSIKTSPGLNRVMEGSTTDEEQQQQQQHSQPDAQQEQYPSNAYLPNDNDEDAAYDDQPQYAYASSSGGAQPSSLARHSSMPVSRAYRRDPSNPGTPWQRVNSIQRHGNNSNTNTNSQYQNATPNSVHEQHDSTATEPRLSGLMGSPSTSSSTFNPNHHPTSPNAPTSPLNSGFVVTSRPNSTYGVPAAAPGHGRSLSTQGWRASTTPQDISGSGNAKVHSPTHSRHASDSVSSSSSHLNTTTAIGTLQQSQLGRIPSNASSLSRNNSISINRSNSSSNSNAAAAANRTSTPSPASPSVESFLPGGSNNPWSPTAQERLHFRELSGTLNLATLSSPPSTSGGAQQQQGHDELASSSRSAGSAGSANAVNPGVVGPISPPSSRRGSAFIKDPSSPRRANSLNLHHAQGRGMRQQNNNRIEEPVPSTLSAAVSPPASAAALRQPQRRNTPILPPLVTSLDALYDGAAAKAHTTSEAPHQVSNHNGAPQGRDVASPPLPHQIQNGHQGNAPNGASKIIRGPASAAPYVPPIGHTHDSDRAAGASPEHAKQAHQYPQRQGQGQGQGQGGYPHRAGNNGVDPLHHFRGFTTAGPGIPENNYLSEKDRIAGTSGFVNQQHHQQHQLPHHQQAQQLPQQYSHSQSAGIAGTPLSPYTPGSLNSAITMQFPSLNNHNIVDPASAAAFTNNLQLQQQLLAQQSHALHEQQNQLAAALGNGLSLQDRQGVNGMLQGSLPTSPLPQAGQSQMQGSENGNDPYAIASKIEALQKANAMLAAAMNDPNNQQAQQHNQAFLQHNQLLQQGHTQYPTQLSQGQGQGLPSPNMFGSFGSGLVQPNGLPGIDPGRPGFINGLHTQQAAYQGQQAPGAVTPIDIHALSAAKGYNPPVFETRPAQARFFVIKSFTEDDVFKSIKFEIWSSTVLGNNRLDKAFTDQKDKGPIYLFFSVNASGHFCGVAEMLTALDYTVTSNVWAQGDKWKGVMKLRWIYIKDIPNPALRHLKLTNTNEQKPVTSSRDTQEVPYEQGCEMLRIFVGYQSKTSLLQDFAYYQAQNSLDTAQSPPSTIQKPMSPYNGMPAAPLQANPVIYTQAGHPNPNPYNSMQHRSNTPLQQQQFPLQQNQCQYQQQQQQQAQAQLQQYQQHQPKNRQGVSNKR